MRIIYRLSLILFLSFAFATMAKATDKLRIELNGIKGDIYQNALNRIHEEKNKESDTVSSTDFIKRIPEITLHSLEPYGYFKASTGLVSIKKSKATTVATFNVDAGPALPITSVNVKIIGNGETNKVLQNFLLHLPLQANTPFNSAQYEKTKDTLFQLAVDQGYIKATYSKSEVQINLEKYTADINLILVTGDRYYFGEINYANSIFNNEFLQRFKYIKPNVHFSSKKLYQFQQSLSSSGYFQDVDATPDFEHIENYHVPVRVALTAPKSQRYDIGLGYGTFTGPRLSAGVNFRRVTDTGQHFNAELKLSSVLAGVSAKYFIPGNNPLTDQYVIGANYQKFSPKNGLSYSKNISLSYIKKTTRWQNTLTTNYLSENYAVENTPSIKSRLLYPSLNISYVKADDLINTHNGRSVNLTFQGGAESFFSSTNFLQGEIKSKYIISPGEDSKLILRGDLGYTVVHSLEDLPLTLRYFAGGINSIRGYPDSSIGPGKYLATASVEYQHRLTGNWYGAAFIDAGTATNHFGRPQPSIGNGVGLVYQSMVGPIRLYLGQAQNKPGKPLSIEFNIGPEF